ncbi:MAG: sulfate adenylyltransferase [Deltaproteobacteria bacterium RIFOXYD12_FULL_57_12]|nr:MAG: sulfate adenylyltransferase [Deltaproteobacteria bacterium RIFOXYD12_FULL_57_12]
MHRRRRILGIFIVFVILTVAGTVITGEKFSLDKEILDKAESTYGAAARTALLDWQSLIREDKSNSDLEKLEKVNQFFDSRMEFVNDIDHWGKEDYWATPVEFLSSQGGDCEDFSLAKYFTLKAMGVAEGKLNLMYVKALRFNQHHMVLIYFSAPGAEPLILDNLITLIKPASERTDLMPIYSFNGTGLWLAKQRERGKLVGGSDRLKLWQDLLQRMPEGLL